MDKKAKYYLVLSDALPRVFSDVIAAKKLLSTGRCKTINEAVATAGISRSAFYKYKDAVLPFNEKAKGRIITFLFTVEDLTGILSKMLAVFADAGANILTINQNIPIGGKATVIISAEIGALSAEVDELIKNLNKINGVQKTDIIAGESME